MQFDLIYLIELLGRLFSAQVVIAFVSLCIGYYILSKFLRVSVFVVLAMLYISISIETGSTTIQETDLASIKTAGSVKQSKALDIEINDNSLNARTADFFSKELSRSTPFNSNSPIKAPFDLLFLSICSIAWDDLKVVGLEDHPLLKEFDIMFDNFNAATSYSGPAVIRLLRASCGQQEHSQLFKTAPTKECYLFENLANLGFTENLLMNHDGVFDSFLDQIKQNGGLKSELMSQEGFIPYLKSFDGSEIYRDKSVLDRWWKQRLSNDNENVVALYNSISLHDGNRLLNGSSNEFIKGYRQRLSNLLDDLYAFFKELEDSKRNIIVALVPEHGAGMRGDKMQIPGMREIPAPTIVHTPVAIKIFGEGIERTGDAVHVKAQSSYLALSQLIDNILVKRIYQQGQFSAVELVANLPESGIVSQNSGSIVIEVDGKYYVSLDGSSWMEYPNN
jgi:cellulose synthase operon protein YhjU